MHDILRHNVDAAMDLSRNPSYRLELHRNPMGRYAFRFTDERGETLMESLLHTTRDQARTAMQLLKQHAALEHCYRTTIGPEGHAFQLTTSTGEVIAVSINRPYAIQRDHLIAVVKVRAQGAPLVDLT